MRFTTLLTAGALAAVALAAPEPQTGSQTTAAVEALESYLEDIATETAFLSIVTEVADNTAGLATLSAFQQSLESQLLAQETPASDFLEALPTQWQSFFGSVYTAEVSILSANGFTDSITLATPSQTGTAATTGSGTSAGAAATGTSTATESANAAPTMAKGGLVAGMLAVGLGGVMIAL